MSRTFRLTLTALALFTLALAAAAPAQADPVVVNGNFATFVPSNATGGGWTSSNIVELGWSGEQFVLNSIPDPTDPTIAQVVSGFIVGQTYTLTGDFAIHVRLSGNIPGFGVDVGGVNVLQLDAPADGSFTTFSVTFIALAPDIEIRFRGEINGTDNSYRIDNIAIQPVGVSPSEVPEPTTIGLLSIGLVGSFIKAWRQRNS